MSTFSDEAAAEAYTTEDSMPDGPIPPEVIEADKVAWSPQTREDFEWVLRTALTHRGEAAKHRAFAAEVAANCESMARDEERQADWMLIKFGPALRAFAQKDIEENRGRPRRSVKFAFGVIGFETEPQKLTVLPGQERLAVAWAKQHRPEIVVEGVDRKALARIVGVNGDGLAVDEQTGEQLAWAAVTPASDSYAPHTFFVKHPSLKKKASAKGTAEGAEADD